MFKSDSKYSKVKEEIKKAKEDSIRERKNLLEEVIMAINEIQDIKAIKTSEKEKDIMRDNIINCKRSKFVDKIIELDRISKQF